ncbi:MAG TPA: hypothetical protein VML95_00670 [Longimicrobiales bacterium]|nr:hypothetical protein [Longimicrobiales bacterium]
MRPLTEREVRRLRGRLRAAEKRERSGRTGPIVAGAAVSAVLWALTLLASDAPAGAITVFWLAVGGGITVWVLREHGRELAGTVEPLRSALRRREAEEYRFAATEFAEVEEAEDEGAAYAFQIDAGRLAFVVGQEFYPEADFPSLDFSIVYAMAEGGHAATMDIESRADRGTPSRKLPARFRFVDDFPEHLEVRTGTIENLERILDPEVMGT